MDLPQRPHILIQAPVRRQSLIILLCSIWVPDHRKMSCQGVWDCPVTICAPFSQLKDLTGQQVSSSEHMLEKISNVCNCGGRNSTEVKLATRGFAYTDLPILPEPGV
jgi:hypothetical protein